MQALQMPFDYRNRLPFLGFAAPIAAALLATAWWGWSSGGPAPRSSSANTTAAATPGFFDSGAFLNIGAPTTADEPRATATAAAQFHDEARDPAWAEASAGLLNRQLGDIPALKDEGGLQIACATTLCEAKGWAPVDLDAANREIYWDMVQGPAMREFMAERGLPIETAEFDATGRLTLYFRRSQPPASTAGGFFD